MHPNYYLSPLVIALALILASPAKAAEPMVLQDASLPELMQKFELSLPGQAKGFSGFRDDLHFISQHKDNNKVTHIRMQQYYLGFPVFGGYAIIHGKDKPQLLMQNPSKVQMNGTVYNDISSDLGQPQDTFLNNTALIMERFKNRYAEGLLSEEKVTPIVYIDDQDQAHWAYLVSLLVNYEDKIPKRPMAIIDAKTYQAFVQWNDMKTQTTSAQGTGFGGNQKVGEYQYGNNLSFLEVSRNAKNQLCFMENMDVKVVNMEHGYGTKTKAMEFPCKAEDESGNSRPSSVFLTGLLADGYDRENGAASPTNDALYAGYVIKHMYRDWYGIDALTQTNGSPMKLVMRVHYGKDYGNAYWDGKQMTFGDGDIQFYPLVSTGIVAHEVSHGFTEQYSGLMYFGQSGGINESFSDMAAQAADFYSLKKNNWLIGAEIIKENSGFEALRYMDDPSRDGRSINTAQAYRSGLDVHYSSGVYNRLFYLLSNQPGWNIRLAFDVMVKANMDYWTPYSTFNDAGCGLLRATRDLAYPLDNVKDSLERVGIQYKSCSV